MDRGQRVIACLLTVIAASVAAADTINVPGDYPTIQGAIDFAVDGDRVEVDPGIYVGSVNFLGKAIEVVSTQGRSVTKIVGSGSNARVTFETFEGADSLLEGFTVQSPSELLVLDFSHPTIRDCVFRDSTVGAIVAVASSACFADCLFVDNVSSGDGGAFSGNACGIHFLRCEFRRNTASSAGGAVYNYNLSTTVFTDCMFHESTSANGGAISSANSEVVITGCIFDGNSGLRGGALYNSNGDPLVSSCDFLNNTADFNGGAMYNTSSEPALSSCNFFSNVAANNGGAIYNSGSNPALSMCDFSENSAADGGAIYGSSPDIEDCAFVANRASVNGGAVHCSSPIIDDCSFTANVGVIGSAIYATGTIRVFSCSITNNIAGVSGGIYNLSSTSVFSGCVFSENKAASYGGGLVNAGFSAPVVTNCTFSANVANVGGGMHSFSGIPVVSGSLFCENRPDDISGGWENAGGNEFLPECPANACPGDADGNEQVGFSDILAILGAWGNDGGPEDVDGSGTVGFSDVLFVLAQWGREC